MAKKYHPDKNVDDTTAYFQLVNEAFEILTDEKLKFKYDLYLKDPTESEYYRDYRYYSNKYVQNPQIHPALVILLVVTLVSSLQYVMRKQMHSRAIQQITNGH